jgi:biopolymer transport protein ExbB
MELVAYGLLVLTSIVGLTFVVERGIALRWRRVIPATVESALQSCQAPADVPMLKRVAEQNVSPLSSLLLVGIEYLSQPKPDNTEAIQTRARHEITKLERGLVVLEIIVGIAPLLGLVGTIIGMMILFKDVGQQGLSDTGRLASGIATILTTTLMGLLIAIPSLIFWSYYTKKVENLAVEMETLCDGFLRRQYRGSSAAAPAAPASAKA